MVFWTSYPFWKVIRTKERFTKQRFTKQNIESAYPLTYEWIDNTSSKEVGDYLRTYFGSPPQKPILAIPEDALLSPVDYLLVARDPHKNNMIVGTIRYHYLGTFNNETIHCVDCFCIHPLWRGKGVGDQLLTRLHRYANERDLPYALFLKEGAPLSILHFPLYTGTYVYRKLDTSETMNKYIMNLTTNQAYRLIEIYQKINPNVFIIENNTGKNQWWKIYKNGIHSILVCFQDTYQQKEGKRMAWATAWLESPLITDQIREEASLMLSNPLYPAFEYVWMNQLWTGSLTHWIPDGQFHWYAYQWTTGLSITRSYCILH